MSRYNAQGIEAEFEPGSRRRVLHNLLGIRSAREMSRAESEALLQAQDRLVESFSLDHRFTAGDICEMHRAWLGHIYSWAGQYRGVNIAKGDFNFAASGQVPRLMMQLERHELAHHTPCRFANHDEIASALAIVHAELILIHPFREGNGRCARLLSLLMGLQAGLPPLDFSGLSGRGKRNYIAAIHAAMGSDYIPMTAIFRAVVHRSLQRIGQKRLSD
jgi:cell filamentation protein